MNFLAHAWLARGGNDAFLYGNMIADGVKGDPGDGWPAEIARGIRHHRRVDAWVDGHTVIREVRARAPRPQRRVVGIALDLVWDHFVARDHADAALIARCYRVLESQGTAPDRLAPMIPVLIEDDWLTRYADFEFTCRAIVGLGRRLSGPNRLAELVPWLRTDYSALERDFRQLWPALNQALSAD